MTAPQHFNLLAANPTTLRAALPAFRKPMHRACGPLQPATVSAIRRQAHLCCFALSRVLCRLPRRVRDPLRLATQYDLVVTTYATLARDYG